jgi:hypothetical protein
MLLHLPASLDELLVLLSGPFSQPSFQTFRAMVVGQISQTGLRTVTGMLVGSRLSGSWHHARAHRFFSNAVWPVDELGLRLAALIVERFVEPGAGVVVAVDDTLLHRLGVGRCRCSARRCRRSPAPGARERKNERRSVRRVAALHGPVKDAASRLAALGPVGPPLTGPLRFADCSARGR